MDCCRSRPARGATPVADARAAGAESWPNRGCAERGDDPPLPRFLFDPDIGDAEHWYTGLRGRCQEQDSSAPGSLKQSRQIVRSLVGRPWIRQVALSLRFPPRSRESSIADDREITSTISRFPTWKRSAAHWTHWLRRYRILATQPSSVRMPRSSLTSTFSPNILTGVATEQGGNLAGFISTLGLRIRGMLADQRLGAVIGRNPPTSFESWLKDYVGDDGASNGQIAVVDLSLVPSEIVHIVVSVLARLIFESLQRYRRGHPKGLTLPTVLVLEEAHTFVRRGKDDDGPASSPIQLCREVFERIAREGRKFGLGLVLSSQRPSELSPTVLAQCNTFLLHRIVNDADQNLVARLVPDNVGGLLRELPSLPSRQAVLLGWAAPIPVLVEGRRTTRCAAAAVRRSGFLECLDASRRASRRVG